MVLLEELGDGHGVPEPGDGPFVRLFGCADQQAFDPFRFEDLPLGIVAEDRRDDIDPDFCRLLGEPFVAVDILGRTDRHRQKVVMAAVVFHPFVHIENDSARVIVHDGAAVEHPVSVYNVDGITAAVAEHPDTMD